MKRFYYPNVIIGDQVFAGRDGDGRSRKARVKVFGNLASRILAVCKARGALWLIQSGTPDLIFGGNERLPRTCGLQVACRSGRSGCRALLISCGS